MYFLFLEKYKHLWDTMLQKITEMDNQLMDHE